MIFRGFPTLGARVGALAAAALLATGCGGPAAAPPTSSHAAPAAGAPPGTGTTKTYTFGAMFPLTGPNAFIGQGEERGVVLAVDQVNAAGGVDGFTLKPDIANHKGNAQGGVQAINQLVNLDHVHFVVASWSSAILAAQPVASANHVLMINVGGPSNELLNKAWLYNNQVMPGVLNPPLARYMYRQGVRRIAVMVSNDVSGRSNAAAFAPAWKALGGTVLLQETFQTSATDFSPQLTQIRADSPQAVYIYATGETQGLILKQARALGIRARLFGPIVTPPAIKVAGNAASGFIDASVALDTHSSDPGVSQFVSGYEKSYGGPPAWTNGLPYEATRLLTQLIAEVVKAGGNPHSGTALLHALKAHPSFHNYLEGGAVHLLADHGADRAIAMHKVEGGRIVTIATVQPGS